MQNLMGLKGYKVSPNKRMADTKELEGRMQQLDAEIAAMM